jgi:hypothetical protein
MFSLSLLRPRFILCLAALAISCSGCEAARFSPNESNRVQAELLRPLNHADFVAKWQSVQAEYALDLPLYIRQRSGEREFYVLRADLPATMQLLVYEKQGVVMRAELRARPLDRSQMYRMMNAWALTMSLFSGQHLEEVNSTLHRLGVQANGNLLALQLADGGRELSIGSATCRATSAESGYFFECSGKVLR